MGTRYTRAFLQEVCDKWHGCGCNTNKLAKLMGNAQRSTAQNWVDQMKAAELTPTVVPEKSAEPALLQTIESLRKELDATRAELAKAHRPKFTIRQEVLASTSPIEGPKLMFDGEAFDIPPLVRLAWIKTLSDSLMSPHVAVMDRRPVEPVGDE